MLLVVFLCFLWYTPTVGDSAVGDSATGWLGDSAVGDSATGWPGSPPARPPPPGKRTFSVASWGAPGV